MNETATKQQKQQQKLCVYIRNIESKSTVYNRI